MSERDVTAAHGFMLKLADEVGHGKKIDYPQFKYSLDRYNEENQTEAGVDQILYWSIYDGCYRLTDQIFEPVINEMSEQAKQCEDRSVAEVIEITRGILVKLKEETEVGKLQ